MVVVEEGSVVLVPTCGGEHVVGETVQQLLDGGREELLELNPKGGKGGGGGVKFVVVVFLSFFECTSKK